MKSENKYSFLKSPGAVIFDIDDTMYGYAEPHELAISAVRNKAMSMFNVAARQFDDSYDIARKQVKVRLGETASSHSRLLYFQRFLELIGLKAQVQLALDFEQTYWRTFLGNAQLFPDVVDFLDDLRLLNKPVAIVTDLTAQIQFQKLLYWNIESFFDTVVTSEEAGKDKPDATIFNLAFEKLGQPTGPVWMIGDSAAKDIYGAKSALDAVTFQKIHAGVKQGVGQNKPDIAFKDFKTLRDILASL